MATQVQWRGGSTAEHSTFTGAAREITVDTQKKTLVVHDGSTAGGNPVMREDGSNSALALGSAASPSLKWDANTGIYSPGADQVAISTGGTGRLFVDASGKLTVNGTGVFGADASSADVSTARELYIRGALNSSLISFQTSSTGSNGFLVGQIGAEARIQVVDAHPLQFHTSNIERARLTADGRLGLGTSAPSRQLDVRSTAIFDSNGDGTGSNPSIAIGSATVGLSYASGSQLLFTTGANERLRLTADGKLGLGTSAPNATLNVSGAAATVRVQPSDVSNAKVFLRHGSTSVDCGLEADIINSLAFYANGTEKARLDSAGRLLVGTSSSPTTGLGQYSKLVVQGNTTGAAAGGAFAIQRGSAATASGDSLGYISFGDNTGATFARIDCDCDGTVSSTSDLPGRLVFSTTADGASSPTERMRIKASGIVNIANAPTYADNTAATAGGLVAGDIYRKADGTLMITY